MLLGYFLLFLIYKKNLINKYVLVLISLAILIIIITANAVLNNTYLLFKTPPLVITISLFLLAIYGSNKGITNISRTSFIFIFVSIFTISLSVLGFIGISKFSNLLPFLKEDFINIIKGIGIFASTSILPNVMLINYKGDLKFRDISKGYIIGCLSIILLLYYIVSIFGYDLSSIVRFPEYLILKKINISGFTNIENVLVMELIATVIICSFVAMKTLKDNVNKYVFYILIILVVLGMNFIVFNNNYINVIYIKYYSNYVFMFLILLSLLIKGKKSF